jgi:hypothetical protein
MSANTTESGVLLAILTLARVAEFGGIGQKEAMPVGVLTKSSKSAIIGLENHS